MQILTRDLQHFPCVTSGRSCVLCRPAASSHTLPPGTPSPPTPPPLSSLNWNTARPQCHCKVTGESSTFMFYHSSAPLSSSGPSYRWSSGPLNSCSNGPSHSSWSCPSYSSSRGPLSPLGPCCSSPPIYPSLLFKVTTQLLHQHISVFLFFINKLLLQFQRAPLFVQQNDSLNKSA